MSHKNKLYVIVYGPDYEDVRYYSDYEKAKKKLVSQAMYNLVNKDTRFYVCLHTYTSNDGVYIKSDIEYSIEYDKMKIICEDKGYTYEYIKQNPEVLYHLIEIC